MPIIHSGVQLMQQSDIAYTSLTTNPSAVILRPSGELTGHHISSHHHHHHHHRLGMTAPTTVVVSQQQQTSQQLPQSHVSLITTPSELSSTLCADAGRSFVAPGCIETVEVGGVDSATGTFHAFVTNDACQGRS